MKLLEVPNVKKSKCTGEIISIAQQCKIPDSTEYNYELNNEREVLSQDGIEPEPQIKWEAPMKTLSIESSPDNGTNRPRTPDDLTQFNTGKGGLPLLFAPHS